MLCKDFHYGSREKVGPQVTENQTSYDILTQPRESKVEVNATELAERLALSLVTVVATAHQLARLS
jgi:hypothetical protein